MSRGRYKARVFQLKNVILIFFAPSKLSKFGYKAKISLRFFANDEWIFMPLMCYKELKK
jgi:hypothetical protein